MRLRVIFNNYQGFVLLLPFFFLFCSRSSEETPVIPPPTNPLVREFIGYGVVNDSFIHVVNEPRQDGASLGYLRKGSLVKIMERRILNNRGNPEIWVLVDAQYSGVPEGQIQGWLGERSLSIFNNEVQAVTAAEAMSP
jgi:hypothetical protein